jgi:hypothetical protein
MVASLECAVEWLEGLASGSVPLEQRLHGEMRLARRVLEELEEWEGRLLLLRRRCIKCMVFTGLGVLFSTLGLIGTLAIRFGWL